MLYSKVLSLGMVEEETKIWPEMFTCNSVQSSTSSFTSLQFLQLFWSPGNMGLGGGTYLNPSQ